MPDHFGPGNGVQGFESLASSPVLEMEFYMDTQTLCPNCRKSADLVTLDSVDYINCPECGWFQTQGDGSMIPTEPPGQTEPTPASASPPDVVPVQNEPVEQTPNDVPAEQSEVGPNDNAPSSPTSDKPDQDDDSIDVTISFED